MGADPQLDVVAEASTPQELGSLPPYDVIVTVGEAARQTYTTDSDNGEPAPAVLLLSDEPDAAKDLARLPLRAWGLLPEDCSEEELLAAVHALNQGLMVGTPAAFQPLLRSTQVTGGSQDLIVEELTDREIQVLELLAEGLANKQAAYQLGISEHTIKFHVSSIYTKLGAGNRTEAVRRGIQLGLILI